MRLTCPQCNSTDSHRHCERCGAAVPFPPFHCGTCSRVLCDPCVPQGCCGQVPAREDTPDESRAIANRLEERCESYD